jgi:UDP-GlcNAc:undecaprenyl-phosphate GlcNAc-1-phosphate transferase
MHLHHRLLSIGHSHRRAVLIMYFWAALLSFGAVALSITGGTVEVLVIIGALLVVGVVIVLSPRARRAAIAAREAELAAMKQRSRAAHPARRPRRGQAAALAGPAAPGGAPVPGPVASGRTAGVPR